MSLAHLHLLLNHVPVLGTYFGILCLALALLLGSAELRRIALMVLALVGVVALPVYLTGPHAERSVEGLPGVSGELIERHEGLGLVSLIVAVATAAAAVMVLLPFRRRERPATLPAVIVLLLALAAGALMGWTANLGGKIRRPEIRFERSSLPVGVEGPFPVGAPVGMRSEEVPLGLDQVGRQALAAEGVEVGQRG
jgi:hypothetical protein